MRDKPQNFRSKEILFLEESAAVSTGNGAPFITFKSFSIQLAEIIREIFDESAYLRFLKRKQAVRSRESYAEFLRENEAAKARIQRCC